MKGELRFAFCFLALARIHRSIKKPERCSGFFIADRSVGSMPGYIVEVSVLDIHGLAMIGHVPAGKGESAGHSMQ